MIDWVTRRQSTPHVTTRHSTPKKPFGRNIKKSGWKYWWRGMVSASALMGPASPTFDLAETISLLEKCTVFFKTFRANGFAECLVSAKELAGQLGAEAEFVHHKRLRKIKKNFDYENSDDPPADPKKLFEVEFFNPLADLALNELDTRFEQLQHFSSIWGFLFDLEFLPEHCDLLEKCRSLENHLAHKAEKDIDGNDMCSELETGINQNSMSGRGLDDSGQPTTKSTAEPNPTAEPSTNGLA
ncbi:hypothetical protein GE061_010971 [Apolygus lucorum]|uniref:Uncharacterized protein n=1 Tax=Apolygus lucorum TaxID=248454 RepID=A0A8S9XWE9_APOLU|nr:hypothetical protein GE061_010971 [Apolygus lucorum]